MDKYIINSKTNRVTKIGSRSHKRAILSKIRDDTKNTTVLTNITREDSKKIKNSLPSSAKNKYYQYDPINKLIRTKNKSLKVDEIIIYISNRLPHIIDLIIDGIDDNDSNEDTKKKMLSIFHDSLL